MTLEPTAQTDTVERAAATPDQPQPFRELGLKDDEYQRIREILGRRPTDAELVVAVPDLRLTLVDSATAPGRAEGEELVFLHYTGTGTTPSGPITIRGMDRVRTRDGIVVENVIRYGDSEI